MRKEKDRSGLACHTIQYMHYYTPLYSWLCQGLNENFMWASQLATVYIFYMFPVPYAYTLHVGHV